MLLRHLGQVTAADRGITVSGATNATPIVITVAPTALHKIPSEAQNPNPALRRFGIFGVTGNTAANGIWSLTAVTADTFSLNGSAGNGSPTMTNAEIALVNDQVPFMQGHSACAFVHTAADQIAFDGTFDIAGNLSTATDDEILDASTSTLATYFGSAVTDVAFDVPGATNDGTWEWRNVRLRRWMYLTCSAYTAGGLQGNLVV